MRRWFLLLAASALLGGCDLLPVGANDEPAEAAAPPDPLAPAYVAAEDDPALQSDTSEAPDADEETPGETAPAPEPEAEAEPAEEPSPAVAEPPPPPDANAEARALCTRKNGSFTRTRAGAFICVNRTRDSGKTCTASGQCEGSCLARSGTCSPVTPLIGCNEIITDSGRRATVCID